MSQVMAVPKFTKPSLIQDILVTSKKIAVYSSVNSAKCHLCGKGIDDGFSITAKSMLQRTVFFCEAHYNC